MTDDDYGMPLASRRRVTEFLDEWARRSCYPSGPDPEVVYALGMSDGELTLRASDLRELCAVIEFSNESSLMEWGSSTEDYWRNRD